MYINISMTSQFSELTLNITKSFTKNEKKEYGIFITPNSIISSLFSTINDYLNNNLSEIKKILEPSCGTCEMVKYCDNLFDDVTIDCIELNDKIYEAIKDLNFKNKVHIYHDNFMNYTKNGYDLIIGNPPYFVCKKSDIPDEYKDYIHGRPNIFGIFILHSLSLLKPGGILGLIVPNSFLNSLYYSKIRNYIKETCTIIKIDDYSSLNDFIDTDQSTFGLVIKKNIEITDAFNECNYSMLFNDNYIFTNNSSKLREIFENSTTIEKMGLRVRTGQIVWNEVKDELTDDEESTLLIYNTNISKDNKLEIKKFKNDEKKQYINRDGRIDPVLVVNRGNGNSNYKLNYAIIKTGPFLIENHLNEIYSPKKMKSNDLLKIYDKIINSFENPKTKKFIEIFLGNNSLSKTELETIFPIYN